MPCRPPEKACRGPWCGGRWRWGRGRGRRGLRHHDSRRREQRGYGQGGDSVRCIDRHLSLRSQELHRAGVLNSRSRPPAAVVRNSRAAARNRPAVARPDDAIAAPTPRPIKPPTIGRADTRAMVVAAVPAAVIAAVIAAVVVARLCTRRDGQATDHRRRGQKTQLKSHCPLPVDDPERTLSKRGRFQFAR